MMLKPKTIQRISTQQHLLEDSITRRKWICTELSGNIYRYTSHFWLMLSGTSQPVWWQFCPRWNIKKIQTGATGFHNDCVMYEVAYSPQQHILLYDYISLCGSNRKKYFSLAHYLSFLLYSIFYRSFRLNQSLCPTVNVFWIQICYWKPDLRSEFLHYQF